MWRDQDLKLGPETRRPIFFDQPAPRHRFEEKSQTVAKFVSVCIRAGAGVRVISYFNSVARVSVDPVHSNRKIHPLNDISFYRKKKRENGQGHAAGLLIPFVPNLHLLPSLCPLSFFFFPFLLPIFDLIPCGPLFLRILGLSYHFSLPLPLFFPPPIVLLLVFLLRAVFDDNINRHKQHVVSYYFDTTTRFHYTFSVFLPLFLFSPVLFSRPCPPLTFLFFFFFSSSCIYVVGFRSTLLFSSLRSTNVAVASPIFVCFI